MPRLLASQMTDDDNEDQHGETEQDWDGLLAAARQRPELAAYLRLLQKVRFADRSTLLGSVIGLRAFTEQPAAWLHLLGETWTMVDNVWVFRDSLVTHLGEDGPIVELMDEDEQAAYDALPDTFVAYRGCGSRNAKGLSWTRERDLAAAFPFQEGYRCPDPQLIEAQVSKRHVLAVKAQREPEIIASRVEIVAVTALNFDPALLMRSWIK
jgi:hypothetical protein